MQLIPEQLKKVLNQRLKSGYVSSPRLHVEVDRMAFVPGYVEELTLYDTDLEKVISIHEIVDGEETVTKKAPMTFPLKGYKWADEGKKFAFTSGFGMRWGKMHKGNDLATIGHASTIVAVYPGKVTKVDYQAGGAGYYVDIQHDQGLVTKYFHMAKSSFKVKAGQHVDAGQELGTEGATGDVTGRHLHFETWVNGKLEDSLPWLKGKKQITTKVTVQTGLSKPGTKTEQTEVGVPGDVILDEKEKTFSWMKNPIYEIMGGADVTVKGLSNGYCRTYFKFPETHVASHAIDIHLNMKTSGYFDLNYSGNFSGKDKDYLEIWMNKTRVAHTTTFNGVDQTSTLKDIHVPSGAVQIKILMWYGGKQGSWNNTFGNGLKTCAIHSFKVQELDKTKKVSEKVAIDVPINSGPVSQEGFIFNEFPVHLQLQTGRFVYQDTLVLPNVQQAEVNRSLDSDAAEATVTVTNPNGYYSPDYNPYYFPELLGKYKPSPYSYYIPGNFHIGVLSENTPIRIYMGYGTSKPVRVFTGLIDSCDMNGGDGTLSVKARDMYKKILNTVLLDRKEYGNNPVYDTPAVQTVSSSSLSRRQQIYAATKKAQAEYKLPDDAYYFLLAICWHETDWGTKGAGRESSGSYILGYGVPTSGGKQTQYKGITTQMHYGAKRFYDAMKSRKYKVDSYSDVLYFWKGGDKGRYQWATDSKWASGVWSAYKKITASKKSYAPPSSAKTPPNVKPKLLQAGKQWLKTAIIQDLVDEAGLYGWRAAADDLQYADALIEESYLIEVNERTGKVVKALPADKVTEETKFETVDIDDLKTKTPDGWLNPFVEPPTQFYELQWKIGDAINELIKDTTYRSYCDRHGTYRLERLNFNSPVVATFRSDDNIISLSKTVDYSRSRSHLVVYDDNNHSDKNKDHQFGSFIDKELLLELKGEVRTAVVVVPWAKTDSQKREVAKKLFFDMKRLARTLQVSIPGNPELDIMDRIKVVDKNSATAASFHIKGVRDSFDVEAGYIQILDLTWSAVDQLIQIPGLVMNTEAPEEPVPSKPPTTKCELWNRKTYKYGIMHDAIVKKIQNYLIGQGYSIPDGATGNYLNETKAAVEKFQKAKGLEVDGIVGQITWNKMFCPSWSPPAPAPVKKVSVSSTIKTRSWRDNWKWRDDNDYIYQGEWDNWGHHYGYIFLPYKDLQAKLKGKTIKSVKLYLHRVPNQGAYSSQKPTFYLHNLTGASGSPSVISSSKWTSSVGWQSNEKKWVTLPKSFGEAIRDGKAKGIATYVSGKSPYIYFYGGKNVILDIDTN